MTNIKLSFLFILFICNSATAQKATLSIAIANAQTESINVIHFKKALYRNFLKESYKTLRLDANKYLKQAFDFKNPEFIQISYYDKATKKSLNYSFYITPGDELNFEADLLKPDFGITVTGKGSNNNQPLLWKTANFSSDKFYGDTVPDRVIKEIYNVQNQNRAIFEQYKKLYKPSPSFIKDWTFKLRYQPISDYFSFKENNKYQIRAAYERTEPSWKRVQDNLFDEKTLNNNEAINLNEYLSLIRSFLNRKKEALWQEASKNPESFFMTWYGNVAEGKKRFSADDTNELEEKIIKKYFNGKSAEYLYAILIESSLESSNTGNLSSVFSNYQKAYPESEYLVKFKPYIQEIIRKQQLKLTEEMVFAKEDGKTIMNFNEVLNLVKGKTVLLDMWGTWCAPCREEIEKNGKAIKDYFQGKGVDYLYVANFDSGNNQKWKELIAYFELKGLHILANQELTKDIMAKIKGSGYPTYAIIKKDGSFELSKAGYPMDRAKLIKQIEDALALKPD